MSKLRGSRPQNKSLRDYLYIDHLRVNSYLEQISSTKAQDKLSSIEINLSMSPSVNVQRASVIRDKTEHEKISELISALERSGDLGHSRPSRDHAERDDFQLPNFVLEECNAARVLIPRADNAQTEDGVVIWLSEWPLNRGKKTIRPAGVLCIIQSSSADDNRHRGGFSVSGYTWVATLISQLRQQPQETQLLRQYPFEPTGDALYDLMSAQQCLQTEMDLLRRSPLEWLTRKGCRILSSERRITALYRIHSVDCDEIGTMNREEDFTISTFGYGIALWCG